MGRPTALLPPGHHIRPAGEKSRADDLQPLHRSARREADGEQLGCLPDVKDGGLKSSY